MMSMYITFTHINEYLLLVVLLLRCTSAVTSRTFRVRVGFGFLKKSQEGIENPNISDRCGFKYLYNIEIDVLICWKRCLIETKVHHVAELLWNFRQILLLNDFDIEYTGAVSHRIDTGDHRPIREALRRHPQAYTEQLDANACWQDSATRCD